MTHFHVTRPSDNSLDTYPNNITSRFTVKLPDRIVLDGDFWVGDDEEIVRTFFTHPHYVPVARTEFQTIEINISDELGRPIPFMHGKTLVTLHFRQRNALLT